MATTGYGHPLFQKALLLESLGNVGGGAAALCFPAKVLPYILTSTSSINPLTVQLTQWLGALFIALAVPLWAAYPDTPAGVANRRPAYLTLGLGEALIIPLSVILRQSQDYPFSEPFFWLSSGVLGAALAFRVYAVFVNPAIMGLSQKLKQQ